MGEIVLSGPAVAAIAGLLGALAVAIRYLHKLLLDAKDAQYKDAIAVRDMQILEKNHEADALRGIAKETMDAGEAAMNEVRSHRGQRPLQPLAKVIPEHQSPPTPQQEAEAELATLRARAAVVLKELGMPPRTEDTQDPKSPDTVAGEAKEKALADDPNVKDNYRVKNGITKDTKGSTEDVMEEAKDKMQFMSEVIIDGATEKLKGDAKDENKRP